MLVATYVSVALILCPVGLVGIAVIVVPNAFIAVSHVYSEVVLQVQTEVLASADAHLIGVSVLILVPVRVIPLAVILASVLATISVVVAWSVIVEELVVGVCHVDAQIPLLARAEDGTVEVIGLHELAILIIGEHITGILVAAVQQRVIIVDGIPISAHHIVHHLVGLIQEVVIDFVEVVILAWGEIQLVRHAVGKETCTCAYLGLAHGGCTQSGAEDCQCKDQAFHNCIL